MLLVLVILGVFFLASKLFSEDFDSFDYTVVAILMFITVSIVYIIVTAIFQVLIFKYGILNINDILRVNILMFIAYSVILLGPAMFIIRHTFMYLKTRMIVAVSYSLILSFLLTYFTGVQ